MSEYCVSCAKMKILEQNTDEAGLCYYQMMENAGTIAANRIVEITITSPINDAEYTYKLHRPVSARVYCGKGNNGGDGFVVARLLQQRGWHVEIVLVDGEPTTQDARENCSLARFQQIPFRQLSDVDDPQTGDVRMDDPQAGDILTSDSGAEPVDVVVDAIYGTGFHGQLRKNGAIAAAQIAQAREKGARVFALDIPSGMGGDLTDEAELDPRCVRADVTITFHAKKPVHLQGFAPKYCGRIIVADIGIVDPDRDEFAKADVAGAPETAGSTGAPKTFDLTAGETYVFDDFVQIISRLRAPDGCPWDRKQTHQTLKQNLLEETMEMAEAIDHEHDENLCEEMGDVLLQIVLHAQIAGERGAFTMDEVIQGIAEKMIRRHPWVFGDMHVDTPEEGEKLWEQIKAAEKAKGTDEDR